MKLLQMQSGLLGVNTYFLINEQTNKAIIIDGGENYRLVKETAAKYGFEITDLLLTHGHFDHAGNAKRLQQDGVKVRISDKDAPLLGNDGNLGKKFGRKFETLIPDYTFSDGDEFEINGIKIKALITPGHTRGSACFIVGDAIFSGDTLFLESVGRTDLGGGDERALKNSVRRLFDLTGDYKVLPGHEESTTLNHERENNFFIEYSKK